MQLKDLSALPYTLLGFDLSLTSTGIAGLEDGEFFTSVLSLKEEAGKSEAHARMKLKAELAEEFEGVHFDAVIVEDVFFGASPKTYRQLLSLNTVVDELLLEGVFTGELVRVDNNRWKKWLSPLLPGVKRGYWKDKTYIRSALGTLGVHFTGVGAQDRADALGMCVGWLLENAQELGLKETYEEEEVQVGRGSDAGGRILWRDVAWEYSEERLPGSQEVKLKQLSKAGVLEVLEGIQEDDVVLAAPLRSLGLLGAQINAPVLPEGGWFHFSLKT